MEYSEHCDLFTHAYDPTLDSHQEAAIRIW